MTYRNIIRGTLVVFGVALGLISSAGAALAATDDSAVAVASESSDPSAVGDALIIERPTPRPDSANELRTVPGSVDAAAGAPAIEAAPVASAAGAGVASPVPVAAAEESRRRSIPRPTEVEGVQFERSDGGANLARTGLDTVDLAVVGVALLGLGTLLVRRSAPQRAR